jgi:hypothetical protein
MSRVYCYINNQFYIVADAEKKQIFVPAESAVKKLCTDDMGRNRDVEIMSLFKSDCSNKLIEDE